MAWNDGLTDGQEVAASYKGSHARLLAGPGTGKTWVISRKIEYLINENNIDPSTILAITFTRAAAQELKKRVKKILGDKTIPRISTLHSFALRQLIRNQDLITELPKPIRIADDWEERFFIFEDLKSDLNLKNISEVKQLFFDLSSNWNTPEKSGQLVPDPKFLSAWKRNRDVFGYTLRSELVYQLEKCLTYISDFRLDPKVEYLIVDEYQDLNKCDQSIIESIEKTQVEIFVAGDDDQSIYGFRNADPNGIRDFPKKFKNVKQLTLEICKRCDPKILEAAEFVASLDLKREPKKIRSDHVSPKGNVFIINCSNQFDEAEKVSNICLELINNEKILPHEILILSRTDTKGAFSKVIQESMGRKGIQFSLSGLTNSIFDLKKARIFLSFLRLLRNPHDCFAWRAILRLQNNQLGEKSIKYIYEFSKENNLNFYLSIIEIIKNKTIGLKNISSLEKEFKRTNDEVEKRKLSLEKHILSNLPIKDWIEEYIDDYFSNKELIDILKLYINQIGDLADTRTIEEFLSLLESSNIIIEQEIEKDHVNFLTMHKAKGLSADAVILIACENEYIPGRQVNTKFEDDERRLLYVSMTRAKHFLFITHCNERTGQQMRLGSGDGKKRRTLSKFLWDIKL